MWYTRRAGKGVHRKYKNEEFDILALVALDIQCIAYVPINEIVLQTIHLRPPGTPVTHKNKRLKNIDEYPFGEAIEGAGGG